MQNDRAHDDSSASRCGDVIGANYVLGEVLGMGGMGVVYAAKQRSLDRIVAIKLPRPDLAADLHVRDRFRREAFAGSRINHPNVVRVLDYGDDGGAPYLVMEHVVGPRLGQLVIDHGPMPNAMAVDLVRQIVAGLEDVHANSIVHADVKSNNILLETLRDSTVVPRLIDFGIARLLNERPVRAGAQVISGTPEYLAPEVICGGAPSFASDVYAVGVLLYELVTGSTPFADGGSVKIMSSKLEADAVPMTWRCPDLEIPSDLDELVVRTLARKPEARFANAAALGRALDTVARRHATLRASPARRSRVGTAFSTEATTATISVVSVPAMQRAATDSVVAVRRDAVLDALAIGEVDVIAVAYLELARALVDERQLVEAVTELEDGVELLSLPDGTGPVWRLLLTLSALHDGIGDRPRARLIASAARDRAVGAGSAIGCERAERLCARLARHRSSTRPSRPW